ncbi:MAG TPA: histidine phosphatase family protein [Rhizomicrobium sp.]|jgi:probable phosphoglycerate mutase|nr:histidine phosphatase family protein [Rhizomicrobium sp.]
MPTRLSLKPGVTLYFARHGETEANRQRLFSGRKPTPLTERGREQAKAIGLALKKELGMAPKLAFVSSPLERARITMEIVRETLGLAPEGYAIDARIEEINLGEWDQLTDAQARARDPQLFAARAADKWNVHVPGGENYAEVAARAADWVRSLAADTFAVSHGAFTRILRGLFLGLDAQHMSALDEPQGVAFRIRASEVVQLPGVGDALSNPKPVG